MSQVTLEGVTKHFRIVTALSEVSFDRGALRFALNVGTGARYFRGTLAGDQLKGTIHTASTGDASVGEFTLRFTN